MEKLTITGAKLFDAGIKSGSTGPFMNIQVRMDYTAHSREEMGWPELPDKSRLMDLEVELPFGRLVMTSQQSNMADNTPAEFKIDYQQIDSFRVVRVKGKKNESSRVELRFNVRSADPNVAHFYFEFRRQVLKGLSEIRLAWGQAAKQIPAVLELKHTEDNGKISNADGMKVGARGKMKQRRQIEDAAAEVSVEMDPVEAQQAAAAIEASLN